MVLKVMMVDSSYKARRDIDNKVKWVENDFELVGEANAILNKDPLTL